MQVQLTQIMNKYRPLGVMKGSEFLLTPDDAIRLIDDLEAIGIAITGVDGWRYVDRDKGWIVQDLEVDLSIDDAILQGEQPVQKSSAIAKNYIRNRLPERVSFVSFTLDIPVSWKLFPDW